MPLTAFDLNPARELATQHFGRAPDEIEEMPGGASLRRFFRVRAGDKRAVAMFFPDGNSSEEANANASGRRWPFLEVQELLSAAGVRVPVLHAEACELGWLLVEDLGDRTLAEQLSAHPETRETLYRTAVRDLARAQAALHPLPRGSIVEARRFDVNLLNWELQHFKEWGIQGRNLSLSQAQSRAFDRLALALSEEINALPYGFVHRDYQSRNLMVVEPGSAASGLGWIDFQDALLGPQVYDLVALLGDSYQTFSFDFILDRLRDFSSAAGEVAQSREGAPPPPRLDQLCRQFDLVTVQRKLKDAGRFVFIEHKKGDSSYLQFVEPTLAKVRMALRRLDGHPTCDEFRVLLEDVTQS